jgi:hypothetical protein
MEQKSLKMVRSGEFDIHTYGDNHCGTAEEFKIRYHLICECSPVLDNRGFLFDQLNIQSYFESIKRTQLSCERLTVVCLEQLLEHILTENPTCEIRRMELTLSPEPFLASLSHAIDGEGDSLTKPDNVSKRPGKVSRTTTKKDESPKGHRLTNLPPTVTNGSEDPKVHDPSHEHKPSHDHYIFNEGTTGE